MGRLRVVVVTLLFAGCQSQPQQEPKNTAPSPGAAAIAVPGGQREWWCSVSENQRIATCDDDAKTCEAGREAVRKAKMSACAKTTQVACFHITGPGGVMEDCAPTMAHCIARHATLHPSEEIHAVDECTMYGIAPPAPTQH